MDPDQDRRPSVRLSLSVSICLPACLFAVCQSVCLSVTRYIKKINNNEKNGLVTTLILCIPPLFLY